MTRPRKKSLRKRDSNPGSSTLEGDALPLGKRGGERERERERERESDRQTGRQTERVGGQNLYGLSARRLKESAWSLRVRGVFQCKL